MSLVVLEKKYDLTAFQLQDPLELPKKIQT
jgi:hypothetical protein